MGPRAGLDRCRKSRLRPGFDPWTVQPVASRYTDWATRPTSPQWRMNILFWVLSPFRKDPLSPSSGRNIRLILPWICRHTFSRKCCYPFTKLHDLISQNNVDFIGCTLCSYKEGVMGGTCNTSGNVNTFVQNCSHKIWTERDQPLCIHIFMNVFPFGVLGEKSLLTDCWSLDGRGRWAWRRSGDWADGTCEEIFSQQTKSCHLARSEQFIAGGVTYA